MKNQGFYTLLSRYYDEIFPLEETIVNFLLSRMQPRTRVLDVACGTATYSLALFEHGADVTGIDSDPDMIAVAKRKAVSEQKRFLVGTMEQLRELVDGTFECVYCIGNSLPHLENRPAVQAVLSDIGTMISPGGVCILQTVNFDRFADRQSAELPSLTGKSVSFSRRYSMITEESVSFDTVLEVRATGERFSASMRLLALRQGELEQMMISAGFSDLEFYGSYDASAYDADSFLTIAVGRRRKRHVLAGPDHPSALRP